MKDQMEVSPLSREVMLLVLLIGATSQPQPLSAPLQNSFRFFHRPIPAIPSAALRRAFPYESSLPFVWEFLPLRRITGLPRSTYVPMNELGAVCPPVVLCLR